MLTTTQLGDADMMAVIQTALKAAGAIITTLRLYQNNYTPDRTNAATAFTEATFDGYAARALTWGVGPYLNAAAQIEIQNASLNFTPTGAVVANTIYGYYVTSAAGDVVWAERFDSPRTLNGIMTSLTLLPSLIVVPSGISGNVQPLDA